MLLTKQCRLLSTAYLTAIQNLKRGNPSDSYTWDQCCEETLKSENCDEISVQTLMNWNIQFRINEMFANPIQQKGDCIPTAFQQYPHGRKQIAMQFLDHHLEELSTDFAAHYFRHQFMADLLHWESTEENKDNQSESNPNRSPFF